MEGRDRERDRDRDRRRREDEYESRNRRGTEYHNNNSHNNNSSSRENKYKEREREEYKENKNKRQENERSEGSKKDNSEEISLSIEETNKLRAQLGLKPLNIEEKKKEKMEKEKEWEEQRKEQKIIDIQSRTEKMREKREQSKKWSGTSIANQVEEESLSSWIERSRKQQSQLAAQFDELDDQSSKSKPKEASASGFIVNHALSTFNDVSDGVILTLKDEFIMKDGEINDSDEVVLENINMVEQEKREKNQRLLKKKPVYNAFDEKKNMLAQYDDEETKNPQPKFKIGNEGVLRRGEEVKKSKEKLLEESKSIYDLEVSKNQIASDYLTPEEMSKTSFKKKKKGERKKTNTRKKQVEAKEEEENKNDVVMEDVDKTKEDDIVDEDDELVKELSRKKALLTQKVNKMDVDEEEELIRKRAEARRLEESIKDPSLIFSSTSEFVKTIQSDIPERREAEVDEEREELQKSLQSSLKRPRHKLEEEVEEKQTEEPMEEDGEEEQKEKEEPVIEDEPLVSDGLASTLSLLKSRGELSDPLGNQQYVGRRNDAKLDYAAKLEALNNRKTEIQLVHRDENGRRLTVKEAFRHLSWNFHGMKPSKNKMEKRMRQMEEDQKRVGMNMTDTPLQSVTAMKNEQERSQTPFIVLSKGNMTATSLPTAVESSREKASRGDKNFDVAPILHQKKESKKKK